MIQQNELMRLSYIQTNLQEIGTDETKGLAQEIQDIFGMGGMWGNLDANRLIATLSKAIELVQHHEAGLTAPEAMTP